MSIAVLDSRAMCGIDAPLVRIEVHLSSGLPAFHIVGLPEKAVKESKDRVRSALLNAGFEFPTKRIVVNLSPADLPKEGSRFDLPIALGILIASGQLPQDSVIEYECMGELTLDGQLLSVPGILPIALAVQKTHSALLVPKDNVCEASVIQSLRVFGAGTLLEMCQHLQGISLIQPNNIQPKYSTIEVAIYQYALFELNFNKTILLSFLQIFICLFFLFIGFYKLKGSNFFEIDQINFIHPHKEYKAIKIIDFLIIVFFSIFLFSPILSVIYHFINNGIYLSLINEKFLGSFFNSLIISVTTGIIVSISGFIISSILVINYKNMIFQQSIFLISSSIIIISPIIFSLGYFIILGELRYVQFFKYFVIVLINCLFLLPFSILILFNNLKNIFLNFENFQQTFRISIRNYFIILLPMIKKNIIFVFAFSTVITFGDFTIISFFKDQNFDTLPSYLYKLISVYKFNEASFVAGVILILSMIIFLLIDNLNYQGKSAIKT